MQDIIRKTRDRAPLTRDEILRWIEGIVRHEVPDYQVAAWLMAVYLNGLGEEETFYLTEAMATVGTPRASLGGLVDKHSTGGVGDKTTLIVVPLVAATGIPIVKMSGRGLGHTGGTLDKLESIAGFRVQLSAAEIADQVARTGVAVVAQSPDLAPADGILYAIRDVTATVDNISLIASSIMSKKLAGGAPNLVLDVKVGSGAFMPDLERARALATLMVRIGTAYGMNVEAVLTTMDQPLGHAVGNAIEVNEALDCLEGNGPGDLREEALTLAARMVHLARGTDLASAASLVETALQSGRARETFAAWVQAQGGDPAALAARLPLAPAVREWRAPQAGYLAGIDTRRVGEAALALGAGRTRKTDRVDPGAGLEFLLKVGDWVDAGDLVARFWGRTEDQLSRAQDLLRDALRWSEAPAAPVQSVLDVIGAGPAGGAVH